jgi:hypothetical protein
MVHYTWLIRSIQLSENEARRGIENGFLNPL